jgi:hypothetical protein
MAFHPAAPAPGQKKEALIEPACQLGRGQRANPCRGQLGRQRDAIQTTAHLRHRARIRGIEREARLHGLSTLYEQDHRVARRDRLQARLVFGHI